MDGSRDILGKILRNEPSRETLLIALEKLKKEGRWNEIIRTCGRFSRIYADDIRIKIVLAEAYGKVGFLGLAEKELEEAVDIIESWVPIHKKLAALYEGQARHEEALGNIRRYLAYFPEDPEALSFAGKNDELYASRPRLETRPVIFLMIWLLLLLPKSILIRDN